tara:strand:- start:64 stop:498 length:435 start_codon:yes stop_codon:yes gene_type:complete
MACICNFLEVSSLPHLSFLVEIPDAGPRQVPVWPVVFYERGVASGQVMRVDGAEHISQLAQNFIELLESTFDGDSEEDCEAYAVLQYKCKTLMQYLSSHMMDPDNSLVGLPPCRVAEEVIRYALNFVCEEEEPLIANITDGKLG